MRRKRNSSFLLSSLIGTVSALVLSLGITYLIAVMLLSGKISTYMVNGYVLIGRAFACFAGMYIACVLGLEKSLPAALVTFVTYLLIIIVMGALIGGRFQLSFLTVLVMLLAALLACAFCIRKIKKPKYRKKRNR